MRLTWAVLWRFVLPLSLALAPVLPAQVAAEPTGVRMITADPAFQAAPATDGTTVVWEDYRSGDTRGEASLAGDIYGARLAGGTEFPVATGPADQRSPAIDGDIVVWQEAGPTCAPNCQYDIRGYNLITGQGFDITSSADDEQQPAISGMLVVWLSRQAGGTMALMVRDLRTMAPPVTLATTPGPDRLLRTPVIDGQRVAWAETDATTGQRWRLLLRSLGTGETRVVAEGLDTRAFLGDLRGDILVSLSTPTPREALAPEIIDLRSGARLRLPGPTEAVTTDGRYVFWNLLGPAARAYPAALLGYDLQTQSRFQIAELATGYNAQPDAHGGVLVWTRGHPPGFDIVDIVGAPVQATLPTAPRPTPTAPSPDRTYFAETGHALAFGFRSFWEHSGGLPVFGFPLTEEFDERNLDTGQTYTVQYVERQRFEYHAEHQGTPYETLLGRLGVAEAQQRGLLGTAAFQPAADTGDPTCTYFPETSHRACGDFRAYWQSHGLEFGDPSVSLREAVALFGYPISEEFTQDGRIVQYFERAVFEYHPQNPEPYTVLLRRLGAELLTQRGW